MGRPGVGSWGAIRVGGVKASISTGRGARGLASIALALAMLAVAAVPAQATFPGVAGPIAYQRLNLGEFLGTSGGLVLHGPRLRDHPHRLTSEPSDIAPAFSPDGRTIVFVGDPDPAASTRPHLYVIKVDGTGLRQLTSGEERDGNPSFSPNGKQVVFDRTTTGVDHIIHLYVVNLAGGAPRQLTRGDEQDSDPVFAPNGRTIAFTSSRARDGNVSGDRTDIFAMDPDGTHLRPLIDGPLKDEEADFSPDGRSLVFTSNRNRGPNVFVANLRSGRVRQLTHSRRGCFDGNCYLSPTWAPDGKHIAMIARGRFSDDLEVIRPDGGGGKTFANGDTEEEGFGTAIATPAWGPKPR